MESFRTVIIIFWGFQNFLLYFEKYFWSTLNSRNLLFERLFATAMETKQFSQFCYNTSILWSLWNLIKSKKKKLALTSFYFAGQETWLDDLWKLISLKCFTTLQIILAFLTIHSLPVELLILQRFLLHVISLRIMVSQYNHPWYSSKPKA